MPGANIWYFGEGMMGPLFAVFTDRVGGDTLSTAQRMESACKPGRVNISESTHALVKDYFHCTYRGRVEVKGKGEVEMYYVDSTVSPLDEARESRSISEAE